MRPTITPQLCLLVLFAACSTAGAPTDPAMVPYAEADTARIIGERIDGPANIRDTINGTVLFTLYDGALVDCTAPQNDWHVVGVYADIDTSEYGMDSIQRGRKIMVDGEAIGEVVSTHEVSTSSGGRQAWVMLYGYTHKSNIDPASIIEPALVKHAEELHGERSLAAWQPFIHRFALERNDDFQGYTLYSNYENWLDDPSPMFRIGLVFDKQRSVAVLHARALSLPNTTDHVLIHGFDCLTYADFAKGEAFVKQVQKWLETVD